MQDKYGGKLEVKVLPADSEEAKQYNLRSATGVVVNNELIPLEVGTDSAKLDQLLSTLCN